MIDRDRKRIQEASFGNDRGECADTICETIGPAYMPRILIQLSELGDLNLYRLRDLIDLRSIIHVGVSTRHHASRKSSVLMTNRHR